MFYILLGSVGELAKKVFHEGKSSEDTHAKIKDIFDQVSKQQTPGLQRIVEREGGTKRNCWDKGTRAKWEIQFPQTPMSNYHNYIV